MNAADLLRGVERAAQAAPLLLVQIATGGGEAAEITAPCRSCAWRLASWAGLLRLPTRVLEARGPPGAPLDAALRAAARRPWAGGARPASRATATGVLRAYREWASAACGLSTADHLEVAG